MNLAGSLDAFALPDVLALLAATAKSGRLQLSRDGALPREGWVDLQDGRITAAAADAKVAIRLRRLSGYGDDTFWFSLGDLPDEDAAIGQLIAGGWLDQQSLVAIGREVTLDAVIDLLQWGSGRFEFHVGPTKAHFTDFVVAEILAEAGGREARPSLGPDAPFPEDVVALPLSAPPELALSRDEWTLIALIDGSRTTREIADLRGRDLDVVRAELAILVARDFVVVCPDGVTPLAGLRNRLHQIEAFEDGVDSSVAPTVVPVEPTPTLDPVTLIEDGNWTPTGDLADLAVPVDREAVMRLIVGVQGL